MQPRNWNPMEHPTVQTRAVLASGLRHPCNARRLFPAQLGLVSSLDDDKPRSVQGGWGGSSRIASPIARPLALPFYQAW